MGISYAMKHAGDGNRVYERAAAVFDPDGTGFRFVAYEPVASHKIRGAIPIFLITRCCRDVS